MQDIVVFGGGAVGSVFAGFLSKKNNVTLVGRKDHVDAINKDGLKINEEKYSFKAVTKLESVGDMIIVSTKANDLESALVELKPLLKKDTKIVCIQNGYGIKEIAEKVVDCRVIIGVTSVASTFLKPGIVSYFGGSAKVESEEVCKLFNESGIKSEVSEDINADMWEKLVINCVVNPLTTILGVKNKEVSDDSLREIKKNIIDECLLVADKEGVSVKLDVELFDSFIKESENISSMLQDIMKKKKTEIDFINGAIVRLAEKHGVDVPVNKSLVSMVRFLE